MDAKEKANDLIRRFSLYGECGKENAITCVDVILDGLKEDFELSKDLHPHAEGLIYGSIVFWSWVRCELENK